MASDLRLPRSCPLQTETFWAFGAQRRKATWREAPCPETEAPKGESADWAETDNGQSPKSAAAINPAARRRPAKGTWNARAMVTGRTYRRIHVAGKSGNKRGPNAKLKTARLCGPIKNCVWKGGWLGCWTLAGARPRRFGAGLRPGRLSRVGSHATEAAKTPPGPEGSNGMDVFPGAVGVLARDGRLGRGTGKVPGGDEWHTKYWPENGGRSNFRT